MKKIFILLLTFVLILSGCSANSKDIDAEKLADDLRNKVAFQDELTLTDENVAEKLYNIDDFAEAYLYIGSGATAEEIAVFKFDNADKAKAALDNAKQRIADQKEDFASYIPEEVKRLDNSVVKQYGTCLVVCVSEGEQAAKIISEYMK